MSNELKLFENAEFGKVRVVLRNGEPWFVAKDVAEALGYARPANAVTAHCKKVNKITQYGDLPNRPPVTFLIIPEGDVYRLVIRSNMPAAEKFETWLMDEVLPSLRKTGQYALTSKPDRSELCKNSMEAAQVIFTAAGIVQKQGVLALDKIYKRHMGYSALEAGEIFLFD